MTGAARSWVRRNTLHLSLALLAYVPLLLTAPGKVPGDTKLYLYLDPWRLMSDAIFSWDSRQFGGWVPHQNVGYLWPSGPWFASFDLLHVPDWIAHRLWMATLLFVAGSGIVHLGRRLALGPTTIVVAAFTYQFTPYVLPYISRTSVLLLPWALLGWIVAASIRFTHDRRLGHLAIFALLILSSGGLNATALLMIAPAPIAFIVEAVRSRRVSLRSAIVTSSILALTTITACVWWLAGLVVQGRYGSAVLSYTEALPSTAATSTAPEVLRGLGYWLFYDRNEVVPLTSASTAYQTNPIVMLAGTIIVMGGLFGLRRIRTSVRRPLAITLVAGLILAVGAYPYSSPTPAWSVLVDHPQNALSLALRSSTRAAPLIVLVIAFGLGTLVDRLRERARESSRSRTAFIVVPIAVLIVLVNLPALLTGRMVDPVMERPEDLPAAWSEASQLLDERFDDGHRGSVLVLPGIESAAFRWGYTVDPILPGLTKKPMLTRDWVPQGSAPFMDLLYALDDSFQNGTADPRSIAPIARLLGADTVMVVNSYQYERFGLDPPARAASIIDSAPGLDRLAEFGEPTVNLAPADDSSTDPLPEIVLYEVSDAASGYRYSDAPIVVSGDGTSLVDLAAAGMIDGRSLVLHSAALDRFRLDEAMAAATELIVTDGNRQRAHHWRGSQDVWGATEYADDTSDDEFDNRLPVFPATADRVETRSVVDTSGRWTRVTATAYGALLAYYPEYRPAMAVDDDPSTSWLVGWGIDAVGQVLEIDGRSIRPITSLRLVQAEHPLGVRAITAASVSLDGGAWSAIDPTTPDGVVDLAGPANSVRLRIDAIADDDGRHRPSGWAEVLPIGDGDPEYILTPTDATGVVDADTPVSYAFTRLRSDPLDTERSDPEQSIRRIFNVAHDDGFVVSAAAHWTGDKTLSIDSECRNDLVSVDFEPVAMRVVSVEDSEISLEACAPLVLEPGQRILSTGVGTTLVLDRITLRSARATPSTPVDVVTESSSRTTRSLDVPACPAERCWLESTDGWNTGWSASIDGANNDEPIASGAGRGTWVLPSGPPRTFRSEWAPQRLMWFGIAMSGLVVLLALMVVASRRLRRWTIPHGSPESHRRSPTRRRSSLVSIALIAVIVGVLVHPLGGLAMAVLWALGRRRPALVAHSLLAIVGLGYAYIVVQQVRYSTPAGFGWPGSYTKVHGAVLLAVVAYGLGLTQEHDASSDNLGES